MLKWNYGRSSLAPEAVSSLPNLLWIVQVKMLRNSWSLENMSRCWTAGRSQDSRDVHCQLLLETSVDGRSKTKKGWKTKAQRR